MGSAGTVGQRLEGIANAVAAAEEDELLAVHHADGRRRPEAMPQPVAEVLGIGREQLAGRGVERDEARRIGPQAEGVLVVHAIGGDDIQDRPVDEHRARRHVVRANAELIDEIELPNDVAVGLLQLHRRVLGARNVFALLLERPVVPVRLAVHVEAQDFARVRHDISAIPDDRRRRADAEILLAVVRVGRQPLLRPLRHRELPERLARLLVEAPDHAAARPLQPRVALQARVIGPDKHAPIGHRRIPANERAELHHPAHILRRLRQNPVALGRLLPRLERLRQPRLRRDHIAPQVAPAPRRPVAGVCLGRGEKREAISAKEDLVMGGEPVHWINPPWAKWFATLGKEMHGVAEVEIAGAAHAHFVDLAALVA